MRTFRIYAETLDAKRAASRDVILDFLRDQLKIRDEDTLLQMSTRDMDPSVVGRMLDRGIIATASSDLIDRIRNGITVKELIDALAAEKGGTVPPSPDVVPDNDPKLGVAPTPVDGMASRFPS